ncbi:hypothetical protein [Dyadobacter sp. LHD-138]|uniref:hypothetical protein n=1 Tax=Dyadobacter sp. LHD-138 TaxID=3071413 RepID=UPI0027E0D8BD|nr:hypothetical protein [Dyadobacter sp. LHD-138]MDQ6482258.1 hypothetical protein [Dyadobacter sp. LHD-138]
MNVQFLSNEKGKKTGVLLTMEDWKEIQKKLEREKMFASLSKSVEEMKLMREGKLPSPDINGLFND